jgi:hypothetical protein
MRSRPSRAPASATRAALRSTPNSSALSAVQISPLIARSSRAQASEPFATVVRAVVGRRPLLKAIKVDRPGPAPGRKAIEHSGVAPAKCRSRDSDVAEMGSRVGTMVLPSAPSAPCRRSARTSGRKMLGLAPRELNGPVRATGRSSITIPSTGPRPPATHCPMALSS